MFFFHFLMAFALMSILSDMTIATPSFVSFNSHEITFFHPLTFNLYVSFALRWVSYRQRIVGSCLFIQSATLCLLNGAFSPLTFKVIIDKYVFNAILNFVFQLILCFFFVPFSFWLDDFLLFYDCVLCFLVFVNVLFGFGLWLPCFSSMLTPSYICLL